MKRLKNFTEEIATQYVNGNITNTGVYVDYKTNGRLYVETKKRKTEQELYRNRKRPPYPQKNA